TVDQLETHFDKWLYFLKHLAGMEDIPEILKEDIFLKGFEVAEIAAFTPSQMDSYQESLKVYRDLKGAFDNSVEEGRKEGLKEGVEKTNYKIVKNLLRKKHTIDAIADITEMFEADVIALKAQIEKDGNQPRQKEK
ncbi:MAG: hypothetical protein GY765_43630, partial [bacterium]|nr:hypothetical protein [bacterium]